MHTLQSSFHDGVYYTEKPEQRSMQLSVIFHSLCVWHDNKWVYCSHYPCGQAGGRAVWSQHTLMHSTST